MASRLMRRFWGQITRPPISLSLSLSRLGPFVDAGWMDDATERVNVVNPHLDRAGRCRCRIPECRQNYVNRGARWREWVLLLTRSVRPSTLWQRGGEIRQELHFYLFPCIGACGQHLSCRNCYFRGDRTRERKPHTHSHRVSLKTALRPLGARVVARACIHYPIFQ